MYSCEIILKHPQQLECHVSKTYRFRITEWVSGVGNREQRLDLGFDLPRTSIPTKSSGTNAKPYGVESSVLVL
ncbi:uncharacterized protein G2W53_044672 [Senna tora]|uniref:Uncharacterized protein n=1 Tax=Senna tora TaxID=362788 RepID=A0A834W087_9FABA|nr:uncharacterized protein G2W53_044672 [Senna tora]